MTEQVVTLSQAEFNELLTMMKDMRDRISALNDTLASLEILRVEVASIQDHLEKLV